MSTKRPQQKKKRSLFSQELWIPRIFGRICRFVIGSIMLYSVQWIISDHRCLFYWIIAPLCVFLTKYCTNIGFKRTLETTKTFEDEFNANLPIFASLSLCLWAVIFDFMLFGFGEFYLSLNAMNILIQFVFYHCGMAYILSALSPINGSVLNAYSYIYNLCITNDKRNQIMFPPIPYFPTYFINKMEFKLYEKSTVVI